MSLLCELILEWNYMIAFLYIFSIFLSIGYRELDIVFCSTHMVREERVSFLPYSKYISFNDWALYEVKFVSTVIGETKSK